MRNLSAQMGEYTRSLARSWGHPESVWTSVSGQEWQKTEVSTLEDGSAVIQAAWTNRRPEARTVLPGDRLLYISRCCPRPSDVQTHLQEARFKEPRRPGGGCHQLDVVRPDEEEDWQSVIDEDEDPAFYSDDEDGGEEIWSDGESRGEPGVRSQMSLAATSGSESDPCTEAPAFQRATRDKREREAERAASPIPAQSPSPSPSPLPSPSPSPLPFPVDA